MVWYIFYITILIFYLVGMGISMKEKIPVDEKKSIYMIPFMKIAVWILRLTEKKRRKNSFTGIKNIALLYPAENAKKHYKEYEIKRMSYLLALIFAGTVFALATEVITLSMPNLQNGNVITRNPYGMGEKNVTLDIFVEGKEISEKKEIQVKEKTYTEEEIADIFQKMGIQIEKEVLGKNQSLDFVCYDLNLVNSLLEYPVDISWRLNDYTVLNSQGVIQEEYTQKQGTPVELTAEFHYLDSEGEHKFIAMVYPPPKTKEQAFQDQVTALMEQYQKKTSTYDSLILPTEIDGKEITYKERTSGKHIGIFILIVLAAIFVYQAKEKDLEKAVKNREREMMIDYPQIVSKLTLLMGAGMTVYGAFARISEEYEKKRKKSKNKWKRYAYEEVSITVREMKSGISELDGYIRFGNRCKIQKYLKLGAMLAQNLKKGTTGLLIIMEAEEKDAFEERKNLVKRMGEEAGTKLLLPMGIMLVIVIVIVVIPAFLSFSI